MHDTLGTLLIDLHLLLDLVEDQIADPSQPVDTFLERLYHRFGERWAVGTPEPLPPPPNCPHPEDLPAFLHRRSLIAYRGAVLRGIRTGRDHQAAVEAFRRHPVTELFPEFLDISSGMLDSLRRRQLALEGVLDCTADALDPRPRAT